MVSESHLHLYDAEDRPGVPAGIIVSVGETRAEAKSRVRDDTLANDPDHDDAGHLLPDEHYAGLTYLGTLEKLRDELEQNRRGWLATGVSTAVVAGTVPESQYQDIFQFLKHSVLGETQIECLEMDCDASYADLEYGSVSRGELQCESCGSNAVVAIEPSFNDSE